MERVVIGKTGLRVYRLGFGGIPIQTVDEGQAVDTVALITCPYRILSKETSSGGMHNERHRDSGFAFLRGSRVAEVNRDSASSLV